MLLRLIESEKDVGKAQDMCGCGNERVQTASIDHANKNSDKLCHECDEKEYQEYPADGLIGIMSLEMVRYRNESLLSVDPKGRRPVIVRRDVQIR